MKRFIIELLIVAVILGMALLAHAQTTIIVTPDGRHIVCTQIGNVVVCN